VWAGLAAAAVMLVASCSGPADAPQSRRSPSPSATPAATATPSPAETSAETPVFPGRRWQRADAGDWTDFDAELRRDGSTCVAVIKDGRLVHDAYWNGGGERTRGRIYSIAKSLTAIVVGMQVDDGAVGLDDSASRQIREWRGTAAEKITVRSLLSMTSGRRWSDAVDRQMIRSTDDQTAFAVGIDAGRGLGSPVGHDWVYDNTAVQTLEGVLDDAAAHGDVVELASRRLLGPLGMRDTVWGRDAAGNALTYSGAESTCLDLARVGHLMLNQGRWDGRQLLSADLVRQLTTPSSDRNAAYGLLWWTNARGRVVEVWRQAGFATDRAPYEGRLAPHVPDDAYWAFGYGNQYMAVVPSEGVVAVRLGARPATPDRVSFDGFTSDVLEAVSDPPA
jgi:CubicO group peptidase (beta-lactamase class C family)